MKFILEIFHNRSLIYRDYTYVTDNVVIVGLHAQQQNHGGVNVWKNGFIYHHHRWV